MGVEVNGKIGDIPESPDEAVRGRRFQEARHVLYGQRVHACRLKLRRKIRVVSEAVLRPARIEEVAGVAERALGDLPLAPDGVDRDAHVRKPVERVEDPEDVDPPGGGLADEGSHRVVGIGRISEKALAAEEHLQEVTGEPLAELPKPLPRILLQEPVRGVEGGPAPHLHREESGHEPARGLRGGEEVAGPHPGCKKRLVGIAEGRVREEHYPAGTDPSGDGLRPLPVEESLERFAGRRGEADGEDGGLELRLRPGLRAVALPVDGDVADVAEDLRAPVETGTEVEEFPAGVDEARVHAAPEKLGVGDHVLQEGDVRLHPPDPELEEGPVHLPGRILEPECHRADLHEERIVVRAHRAARERRRPIETDPEPARGAVVGDPPGVREEVVFRILGRDPTLDRVSLGLGQRQGNPGPLEVMAFGDPDLRLDEVDAEHELGDGVLHLDARIHLDEVVRPTRIHEKLRGPGAHVAGIRHERTGRLADCVAKRGIEADGRCHLDDLLVAALDRTVPLPEVDDRPLAVAEDLHLDVPRLFDEPLQVDRPAPEGTLGFTPRNREDAPELRLVPGDPHPASPPTGRGLHDHRIAGLPRKGERGVDVPDGPVRSGDHRHARTERRRPRRELVPEQLEVPGRRTDEVDTGLEAASRELRILREEPVAGVDRIDPVAPRKRQDRVDVQVRLDGTAFGGDEIRLVRLVAVECEGVLFAVDRDRALAELGARAKDADRNLAPVRHQNAGILLQQPLSLVRFPGRAPSGGWGPGGRCGRMRAETSGGRSRGARPDRAAASATATGGVVYSSRTGVAGRLGRRRAYARREASGRRKEAAPGGQAE